MELVRGAKQQFFWFCVRGLRRSRAPEEENERRDSRNESKQTVVHPCKSDAVSSYVPNLKPCPQIPGYQQELQPASRAPSPGGSPRSNG